MALAVKQDEAFDPVDVGLLRPQRVVPQSQDLMTAAEERGPRGFGGSSPDTAARRGARLGDIVRQELVVPEAQGSPHARFLRRRGIQPAAQVGHEGADMFEPEFPRVPQPVKADVLLNGVQILRDAPRRNLPALQGLTEPIQQLGRPRGGGGPPYRPSF